MRSCADELAAKQSTETSAGFNPKNKAYAAKIIISCANLRLTILPRGLDIGKSTGLINEWSDAVHGLKFALDNALARHRFIYNPVRKNHGHVRIFRSGKKSD